MTLGKEIPDYFDNCEEVKNCLDRGTDLYFSNKSDDVVFIEDIIIGYKGNKYKYVEEHHHLVNDINSFNENLIDNIIRREYKPIIEVIDSKRRLRDNFNIPEGVDYFRVKIGLSSKIEKLIGIPINSLLDRIDELNNEIKKIHKGMENERKHLHGKINEQEDEICNNECNNENILRFNNIFKNLKFIERLKYLFLGSKYFS